MKKALLGLCNNIYNNRDKIKIWSESFKKFSDGDVILLAANSDESDIEICNELGIKPISVNIDDICYINHKRLEHTFNFLKVSGIDYFLITDVFDVVFQGDPFMKLNFDLYDVFTSGEGVNINQEPWNTDNIKKLFPDKINKCSPFEVINSGVIAGKRAALINVYERMYNLCEMSNNSHNIKDQAAWNVMIYHNEVDRLKIFNLDDGWVMHCAVAGPTEFFETWGFKNNIKYGIPVLNGHVIYTANAAPYDIVHQFNRVPEWHKIIKEKYNING